MKRSYGYNDPYLVPLRKRWTAGRFLMLILAIAFLVSIWFALDQKLLFGDDWMSPTYDRPDWRTNEGDLATYGMWDLETHIYKTEWAVEHYPNLNWNPYWYMGMPLFKYYQQGYYLANFLVSYVTGTSIARASTLLVIFAHLLATLLTFLLCYKISRKIWASALASSFVLSNTFISLRSYGWEPITVVFLFLYPLTLLAFLKEPLKPFRLSVIILLAITYVSHPLLFFALAMFMGLYLLSIALRNRRDRLASQTHYIWAYLAAVFCAVLLGAFQFFPQASYEQATSGAHMGVSYLPFYQVPPNIINLQDFFFDMYNLKGPGPVIMIAFALILVFALIEWRTLGAKKKGQPLFHEHELAAGIAFVLVFMVLFYYLELYNIFPMNLLRSIQYHRIIPEFIITAAMGIAALSNLAYTYRHKVIYYAMLVAFVFASFIVVYGVQEYWETSDSIDQQPEFIYDEFEGRFSNPYSQQSLAVRNSFTNQYQIYGYYEQGITNSFADEIMSVSSGFHNAPITLEYLKAANVERLYVNNEAGNRDKIVLQRMAGYAEFVNASKRYSYFEIPVANPHLAQAVSLRGAMEVQDLWMGCRVMFEEEYCGSTGEEFVTKDPAEYRYLKAYNDLLERPYSPAAMIEMLDPDHYRITVDDATTDTAVVVKMTRDMDFSAVVDGQQIPITRIGPDYMLLAPLRSGSYEIALTYNLSKPIKYGTFVTLTTLVLLLILFATKRWWMRKSPVAFPKGDMDP